MVARMVGAMDYQQAANSVVWKEIEMDEYSVDEKVARLAAPMVAQMVNGMVVEKAVSWESPVAASLAEKSVVWKVDLTDVEQAAGTEKPTAV